MANFSQGQYSSEQPAQAASQELRKLETMMPDDLLRRLKSLDPTIFEHLTALLFKRRGYEAHTVGTSGDEGVDVLLRKGKSTSVVQCKRYNDSVGQSTIRDLYGTMVHNQATNAFLVTTGNITKKARDWAEGKPIHLVDGMTLTDWIIESAAATSRRNSGSGGVIPRRWLWPVLALVLIIFGVAIGLAFTVFSDRMSSTIPANESSTVLQSSSDAENEPIPANSDADAATGDTSQPESNQSPEEPEPDSATPAATATFTPLPTCPRAVIPEFESLFDQSSLGCPSSDRFVTWAAWQPFERGYLFWRSDEDTSYALLGTNRGTWRRLNLAGGLQPVDRGQAPAGLQKPVRGFGFLWSTDDSLFDAIGWATVEEKGFCVQMQGFDNGLILQSTPVDSCTDNNLYNHAQSADWQPVTIVSHVDGRWATNRELPTTSGNGQGATNNNAEPESITASLPTASNVQRPASHGLFSAQSADTLTIDGDLADWAATGWMPIQTIVWGQNEHNGSPDLAGDFQIRWSQSGLWIAVRVTDDTYRSGPYGTNMWQGDGLELHFDRLLSDDLGSSVMTDDDYQIGISFGPSLNDLTAYRWIPFEIEGSIPINGKARSAPQGYEAEFMLPWSTFGVGNEQLKPGTRFGFNLSINDNDSLAPAQQTTMSASPARTDHKTPTEWGTLVLE